MKTYAVDPMGVVAVKKRMDKLGAAMFLVVVVSMALLMRRFGLTPFGFGFACLVLLLVGGTAYRRALRRVVETWPSYTLIVADDFLLRRQAHYPDVRIGRDEVRSIWRMPTGDIVVKTRRWMKFISIPAGLDGRAEVEERLGRWVPVRLYPRARMYLYYALPFLVLPVAAAAAGGFLDSGALSLPVLFGAVLAVMTANLLLQRMLRRSPHVDERARPKRWQIAMMAVVILLLALSMAAFFGLQR